jgi:hypothetical protein
MQADRPQPQKNDLKQLHRTRWDVLVEKIAGIIE